MNHPYNTIVFICDVINAKLLWIWRYINEIHATHADNYLQVHIVYLHSEKFWDNNLFSFLRRDPKMYRMCKTLSFEGTAADVALFFQVALKIKHKPSISYISMCSFGITCIFCTSVLWCVMCAPVSRQCLGFSLETLHPKVFRAPQGDSHFGHRVCHFNPTQGDRWDQYLFHIFTQSNYQKHVLHAVTLK